MNIYRIITEKTTYMPTLKHVFTINHSGIFRGNGTFLQMPVSIKPGCKQLAVTPAIKINKIDMWFAFSS